MLPPADGPAAKPLLPGAAIPEHLPGEILVQFKPGTSAAARRQARGLVDGALLEEIHTATMQRAGQGVLERLSLGNGQGANLEAAMAAIARNPNVIFAERNYIHRPAVISNDTYYTNGSLWGMYGDDTPTPIGPTTPSTTNLYGSQAEKAWNDGITGSRNVAVGIIDEGIQISHPDLAANIWVNPFEVAEDGVDNDGNGYIDDVNGWDFFYNNNSVYDAGEDAHGTHVAGTIGGVGGNGSGVVGVNWAVTMIAAKFLGPGGGSTVNAVKAVDYLTDLKIRHGLNLVASNNSWGGGGYSQALHDAIIRSAKADILFVAAAGNASANNDAGSYYPSSYNTAIGTSSQSAASYDGVIAVASITNTGALSSFSSYGATTVDLGAPGSGIWSSVPTNSWASYNGTSMATPHVTGALALYASAQPFPVGGANLKEAILESTTPTASLAGKTLTGGRLNVYAALQQAAFLNLDASSYGLPATIGISVQDPAGNLNATNLDSVAVQIRSATEAGAETVTLIETGANTGIFRGSVNLEAGTAIAGDGRLQAAHGETITATYAPLNQSVSATVDAVSPTITGVTANPSALAARISWSTNEAATTEVLYGTASNSLNQRVTNNALTTSHSATLMGLSASTRYYYQAISRDATGNISTSAVGEFSTTDTAPILFVDDDQGATYERFFQAALNASSYTYDTWDAHSLGATPSAADLAPYGKVVWNTGYDYSASTAGLSSGEQTAITSYLNSGGRLFLSGQDILWNGVSSDFLTNILKVARFVNDDLVASHTQSGLAGNSISSGMSLALSRPTDFPSLYVDDLTPVAGAEATLESPWGYSSVNYRGDYSRGGFGIVFLSAPFEAISTTAADPNNQKVMMQRIMTYLDSGTPSPFVLTAPSTYTTSESGSGTTFGVRLAYEPTDTVTIPVSSSDTSEGTVTATSLTFTPSNWNTTQNIAVSAVNDAVDDGDIAYRIMLGAATSNDARFNGAEPVDLYLTNIDNDTRGISVSPPSGTATTEGGGTVTFSVKLNPQPTANVTIAISSSDTTEGTVSTNQLTFTSSNWNTAQTVTVSGVNDNLDDGDIAYTAVIGTSSSTDTLYNGINPADITLTNLDNDTSGINVSAPSGTSTTESGGQVSFSVKLETQPTATVTLPISSSDTTEGTVSTNQLTFTTSNWNTPQTVTVTGADDGVIDGTIAYTALIGTSSSADTLYNGLDPADIALTNLDNDAFGITISEPSSSTTSEAGGQTTFTVKLNSQPTADVTIPISSSNTREGNVSPGQLVFTSANWNTAQTVTVTGVNDDLDDGDIAYSILLGNAISSDSTYNGFDPEDVAFVNSDNDTAGITVSAPNRTTTSENGDSATFSVRLNSQPTANVTIDLSSSDTTEGSVAPASLTFTASDWSTPQTVTVRGVNDDLFDGTIAYAVVIAAAASSDGNYNGINPDNLNFSNTDNDPAPVTKFFVVDDGTSDRTFEYSASGARVEDYPTATTAPRGIATTAAGTTTWVVDNAKKIFVYNDSGASLGSWNLSSLVTNAVVQGVATDGTHLWVVDATAKRVYYYANAAARRSGSQKATSSFLLASANANPTDIVFGTSGGSRFLWVVNNTATTDSVFRYTLGTNNLATSTGLTSWTLDSANSNPTGIALDPSNVSQDLWIVDSDTDRVYRYGNARNLGAPTLSDSFALAAGNTNPQGIADPVGLQAAPEPLSAPRRRRRGRRGGGRQPWSQATWLTLPSWAQSWWHPSNP